MKDLFCVNCYSDFNVIELPDVNFRNPTLPRTFNNLKDRQNVDWKCPECEFWNNHNEEAADDYASANAIRQDRVNSLVGSLDGFIAQGLDGVMRWIGEFTPLADWGGIVFPREEIIQKLEAAGYVNGMHVGAWPDAFTRQMTGEWVVGQAISCMSRGMPPHPIATMFVEKYFAKSSNP